MIYLGSGSIFIRKCIINFIFQSIKCHWIGGYGYGYPRPPPPVIVGGFGVFGGGFYRPYPHVFYPPPPPPPFFG